MNEKENIKVIKDLSLRLLNQRRVLTLANDEDNTFIKRFSKRVPSAPVLQNLLGTIQ